MQNFLFGGFNWWEISVYFGPLYVLVKTLLDALSHSAMFVPEDGEVKNKKTEMAKDEEVKTIGN